MTEIADRIGDSHLAWRVGFASRVPLRTWVEIAEEMGEWQDARQTDDGVLVVTSFLPMGGQRGFMMVGGKSYDIEGRLIREVTFGLKKTYIYLPSGQAGMVVEEENGQRRETEIQYYGRDSEGGECLVKRIKTSVFERGKMVGTIESEFAVW